MKERGQALLALLTILSLALGVALFTFLAPESIRLRREAQTQRVMMAAKEALIGYAAASSVRPGQLPCPDTNNDGLAEPLNACGYCLSDQVANCATAIAQGLIGRLPWRTLGLDDPRDSAGERLWYAPSPYFTSNPSSCSLSVPAAAYPTLCYLNSDTRGNLTVYQDSTATTVTSEAVAVIFAPGQSILGQIRGPTDENNAVNYLDIASGVNNATGPSFIKAQLSDSFNDRVMVIDTSQVMPVVEERVAREVIASLKQYKNAVGVYPWADCADGSSDFPPSYQNRGRIPWRYGALSVGGSTLPVDWGSGGAPYLPGGSAGDPGWFVRNYWSWVIYYAAGKNYLEGGGAACTSCVDATLTLTGVGSKELVIIMTGPASGSRPDPSNPPGTSNYCNSADWASYLDDAENKDLNDDTFVFPSSTAYARDRIYTCPGTPGIC